MNSRSETAQLREEPGSTAPRARRPYTTVRRGRGVRGRPVLPEIRRCSREFMNGPGLSLGLHCRFRGTDDGLYNTAPRSWPCSRWNSGPLSTDSSGSRRCSSDSVVEQTFDCRAGTAGSTSSYVASIHSTDVSCAEGARTTPGLGGLDPEGSWNRGGRRHEDDTERAGRRTRGEACPSRTSRCDLVRSYPNALV